MQHGLEPSATGFQPDSRLNSEAVSWLACRGGLFFSLVLDRTVLTRGVGKKQAAIICRAAGVGERGRELACKIPH